MCTIYLHSGPGVYRIYSMTRNSERKSYTHRKWKYNCRNSYVDILFTLGNLRFRYGFLVVPVNPETFHPQRSFQRKPGARRPSRAEQHVVRRPSRLLPEAGWSLLVGWLQNLAFFIEFFFWKKTTGVGVVYVVSFFILFWNLKMIRHRFWFIFFFLSRGNPKKNNWRPLFFLPSVHCFGEPYRLGCEKMDGSKLTPNI